MLGGGDGGGLATGDGDGEATGGEATGGEATGGLGVGEGVGEVLLWLGKKQNRC